MVNRAPPCRAGEPLRQIVHAGGQTHHGKYLVRKRKAGVPQYVLNWILNRDKGARCACCQVPPRYPNVECAASGSLPHFDTAT